MIGSSRKIENNRRIGSSSLIGSSRKIENNRRIENTNTDYSLRSLQEANTRDQILQDS